MVRVDIGLFWLILVTNCSAAMDDCISNPCHANAWCSKINQQPGYKCECIQGYEGDGHTCKVAVDDCNSNPCHANARCSKIDQQPGYKCECIQGYEGDGHTCKDVDECRARPYLCLSTQLCKNTPGSYKCTCFPGYQGAGCQVAVDDCNSNPCHAKARCSKIDQQPGYKCECIQGYEGDGHTCKASDAADGMIFMEFDGNATVKFLNLFYKRPFTIVIKRTSEKIHKIKNIKCHFAGNKFQDFTKNTNGIWDQQKHVYTVQEDKATFSMYSNWTCNITHYLTPTTMKHHSFNITEITVKDSDKATDVSMNESVAVSQKEVQSENKKYLRYDTPYEWQIWRFGVNPNRRPQPPRRPGSLDIQ